MLDIQECKARLTFLSRDFLQGGEGYDESGPAMSKEFATSIVQTLRQHGFQGYLVGGCVRDLLLVRDPKDYDVATNAMPEQVMGIFPETYAVGAQFGVVLVPLPESDAGGNFAEPGGKANAVEVATFRSDIGYS